ARISNPASPNRAAVTDVVSSPIPSPSRSCLLGSDHESWRSRGLPQLTCTASACRVRVPLSQVQCEEPVIWGDDIGISNVSCYSEGLMGYRTPNIDRIAAEGVR